jgi:hypothetical protein
MPEGRQHRRCKDELAKLIKAAPQERLIRKGLRADRAGKFKDVKVYGEVDCTLARGKTICVLTIYKETTGKKLLSVVCPDKRKRRRA